MGINQHTAMWMRYLVERGVIGTGRVLEFGPQSVYGGNVLDFYRSLGIEDYYSMDLYDSSATFCPINFNEKVDFKQQYSLATNFGTFEHVCNIGQAFKTMHEVVEPNGVMLHNMAVFGYPDHGFYTVHPSLYIGLAAANNYVIEDFRYVDGANQRAIAASFGTFDLDSLPIKLDLFQGTPEDSIQRTIRDRYVRNITNWTYNDLWDCCLVALRKTSDAPFKWAMQSQAGITIT